MASKRGGIYKRHSLEACEAMLDGRLPYPTDADGREALRRSLEWWDAVENGATWAAEAIKKGRKRTQAHVFKRLGRLKRGQSYVVQWPRTDWVNGYPTGWTKWKGIEPADRWAAFLVANPVRLYCSTWCFPPEMVRLQEQGGAGMAWKAGIRWTYELAGVACAGCGRDLAETKGTMGDQRRAKVRKTRVRKPTKPRGLVTLAQVRKQMKAQEARIRKLR